MNIWIDLSVMLYKDLLNQHVLYVLYCSVYDLLLPGNIRESLKNPYTTTQTIENQLLASLYNYKHFILRFTWS